MARKRTTEAELREPKRLNRSVSAGEALGRVLDEALRRRGFASRDLIAHWAAMAPKPYDERARPDRLVWPRGARGTEGATLYLRCAPGHALALAHEGQAVAAAINRYFGYVLVGAVRLSAEPLRPEPPPPPPRLPSATATARIESELGGVDDEGLREALKRLGSAIAAREP
jgi:hypothetical protein